ncbi:DoxX family membrane protein [Herbiconiux sp. P15]|uniref:DoxX family protein n=1 Tax=Herbiconiux liukaitaii TaxID=3342799 RepID=UPI0035BA834D
MDLLTVSALVLRILLAVVFIGMGISHFVPASVRAMAAMIPPRLRSTRITPRMLVYVTGVCEIAGGLGLLFPPTRIAAGIALVVFLAAVFPANAYAARHKERFGALAIPFWPRLIGQIVLAALILVAAFL